MSTPSPRAGAALRSQVLKFSGAGSSESPPLALLYSQAQSILALHPVDTLALQRDDRSRSAGRRLHLQQTLAPLLAPVLHAALWIAPLLAVVLDDRLSASAVPRSSVAQTRPCTLAPDPLPSIHILRLVALAVIVGAWYLAIRARRASSRCAVPSRMGKSPAWSSTPRLAIIATLGLLHRLVHGQLDLLRRASSRDARNLSPGQSLAASSASARSSPSSSKSTSSSASSRSLSWCWRLFSPPAHFRFRAWLPRTSCFHWYIVVTVLYLIASDFFHVVHLVGYLDLWNSFEPPTHEPSLLRYVFCFHTPRVR